MKGQNLEREGIKYIVLGQRKGFTTGRKRRSPGSRSSGRRKKIKDKRKES